MSFPNYQEDKKLTKIFSLKKRENWTNLKFYEVLKNLPRTSRNILFPSSSKRAEPRVWSENTYRGYPPFQILFIFGRLELETPLFISDLRSKEMDFPIFARAFLLTRERQTAAMLDGCTSSSPAIIKPRISLSFPRFQITTRQSTFLLRSFLPWKYLVTRDTI